VTAHRSTGFPACKEHLRKIYGFLKVQDFGGEFGKAISFCGFSANIALSRHKSQDLSSDFEKGEGHTGKPTIVAPPCSNGENESQIDLPGSNQ
jgi:hypothetical protein